MSAAVRLAPRDDAPAFVWDEPGVGRFTTRLVEPSRDAALLHRWITSPHARFWNMADRTVAEIEAFYAGLNASGHARAELGLHEGRPVFLTEIYEPAHDQVGEHYDPAPGDRGMHVLVAPAERPIPRFTLGVMRAVMARVFDDPTVARVVVEPDIRNAKIHALNRKVGFGYERPLTFREKTAHLAFCTREAFFASVAAGRLRPPPPCGEGEGGGGSESDAPDGRRAAAPSSLHPEPPPPPTPPHKGEGGNGAAGGPRAALRTRPTLEGAHPMNQPAPASLGAAERAVAHLTPELWARANRHLVAKAIAEFAHEKLIEARLVEAEGEWGRYALDNGDPNFEYGFRARRLSLDHWLVDEASLEKRVVGLPVALDAQAFILEFQDALGIRDAMAPIYLEEIASTLYGAAFKEAKDWRPAAELARADHQTIEAAMSEGHPTFVANNGRIGFDAADYRAYAPEAASPVRLVWLAVSREAATFTSVPGLDFDALMERELGAETLRAYRERLAALELDAADYLFMPAHPWQWFNKLAVTFAADIAARRIVCLGQSDDRYQAQQSIRTFHNLSRPDRSFVKTAISVLNMGFMRGLSPKYMVATPAINDWLDGLIAGDAFYASKNFSILREVAAVGYRFKPYDEGLRRDSAYKKMLSALWRESPAARLEPGERLATMAALLHVDPAGEALLPALIEASGLDPEDWLRRYLDAYLSPLVHSFYAHDLAFMPHGENLILRLKDHAPVGVFMKDIGEEIGVLNGATPLPKAVERIGFTVAEEAKLNCLFTDVFDCFFRYLSATLVAHCGFRDDQFWALVAETVHAYLDAHPEHAEKARTHDLFAPTFVRNCLNRLQLNDNQQMLDLLDPEKSLQFVGVLENPLAPFARG